ncbi:formin-like protein 5 [Heracleum sosnowskyi]|uniref:Formin-like protein n=1 Tax=Heracleum sosnowskyi TaxID=360622 RepID=A0AAD8INZ7_9APIA|nr:formin-like protein 5 [Heracleum sosnowskyi]
MVPSFGTLLVHCYEGCPKNRILLSINLTQAPIFNSLVKKQGRASPAILQITEAVQFDFSSNTFTSYCQLPAPFVQSSVKTPVLYFLQFVRKLPPPRPVMRYSNKVSSETSDDSSNNSQMNIAVIAACSVAAIAVIALFFFCCLRGRRNKVHPKHDIPVLNLGSSNISPGPAKDFSTLSNVNSFSVKPGNSVAEEKQSEDIDVPPGEPQNKLPLPPQAKLPLPPGRVSITPPKPVPLITAAKPATQVPGPPVTKATEPTSPVRGDPRPPSANNPAAPPPPPKIGHPTPPNPPRLGILPKQGLHGKNRKGASESDNQKAKLKPFFWDKVLADPEHSMVWNEIKTGSFQFDEKMMEDLFGYNNNKEKNNEIISKRNQASFESTQFVQILDAKKSQNLSILLKAINVTTKEVCDAIQEGNELPAEFIETLLKMAPTPQEELRLRLYDDDISKLGPADRFIKTLIEIPFAYKRLEALLFMCTLQNETSSIKDSLAVLEVACKELKNSRVFLKLLEAVLKTGNRMNDGTFRGGAQAFKLDTLLKLSDVKGADGKTTLLHFVILEIIRTEGIRAARRLKDSSSMNSSNTENIHENSVQETPEYLCNLGLDVVSNLSTELANVIRAAVVDGDVLTNTVTKLGFSLKHCTEFLNNEMSSEEADCEFCSTLASFIQQAEYDIVWMLEEEKRINGLVMSTAEYFHGTPGRDEGMHLFIIVRDFLVMVDKINDFSTNRYWNYHRNEELLNDVILQETVELPRVQDHIWLSSDFGKKSDESLAPTLNRRNCVILIVNAFSLISGTTLFTHAGDGKSNITER